MLSTSSAVKEGVVASNATHSAPIPFAALGSEGGGGAVEGWLTKRGSGFPYPWQVRYFVLAPLATGGFHLRYYATSKSKVDAAPARAGARDVTMDVRSMTLKGEVCAAHAEAARPLSAPASIPPPRRDSRPCRCALASARARRQRGPPVVLGLPSDALCGRSHMRGAWQAVIQRVVEDVSGNQFGLIFEVRETLRSAGRTSTTSAEKSDAERKLLARAASAADHRRWIAASAPSSRMGSHLSAGI